MGGWGGEGRVEMFKRTFKFSNHYPTDRGNFPTRMLPRLKRKKMIKTKSATTMDKDDRRKSIEQTSLVVSPS